jgi:hypothetical protein
VAVGFNPPDATLRPVTRPQRQSVLRRSPVQAGAAFAADYPGGSTGATGDPGSQVAARTTTNSSTLPFTGGDVAGLAAIGAGAAVAGVVMVRHGKKKAAAPA